MGTTYTYDHGPVHHLLRHLFIIVSFSIVIMAVIAGAIIYNARTKPTTASGQTKSIPPASSSTGLTFNEPFFTMQLPAGWQQTGSKTTASEHSISWQSKAKNADNRYLTIYVDTIPTSQPVNFELPVTVNGNQLSYGPMSDNCSDFTPGGTMNVNKAEVLPPAPSVWQGVNFICDIPKVLLDQVGTGVVGSPVNTVTITGPGSGTHKYFFLYTDLNIDPDYSILLNAVQSFRAK